ncbi:Teichoic acid export ATP-binding protein TagH [uncultured Rubrobacteraceae bacterium]|uniref:Teichoic acid export ATP-binding protein TagH n=1 Tax=uncultured Rubrobacteraceae bacterium TaxID=349277 RepID=A0A6J4PNK1_9ACTN|nr:Teichoic acid export ATP-binding protein TagH [uncultured Rubrobacteraceae bacterium]
MTPAISLRGIGKKYRIASSKSLRLREILSFGRKQHSQDFWALEDVDLEVQPGTTLGIIGRNGAGKSTLLQIVSGVLQPTTGTVEVNGRLTAIFGLGSGFNPEFTGRENAMMNGLILGMDRREMLDRFEEIEAFADIGDFIDQPVRTYSSGMKSRLGFAVAVNVEPDILVIDEALSAGDAAFKKKALRRMYDLRDSGTTVLFVSHSMGMVSRFCTDAVLLHRGHMIASGTPDEIVGEYREVLEKSQDQKGAKNAERDRQLDYTIAHEDEDDMPDSPNGKGQSHRATGEAEVLGVELLDENRGPADRVSSGSNLTVRVLARYARAAEESALGIVLRDRSGTLLFATSTDMEGTPLGARAESEIVTVDFTFWVPLRPGGYGVEATVSGEGGRLLGQSEDLAAFEVVAEERQVRDVTQLPTTVEVHGRDPEEQGQAT